MELLKSFIPFMLLWLWDVYLGHTEGFAFFLLCVLLCFTQVTRYIAGYKRGFLLAKHIGEQAMKQTIHKFFKEKADDISNENKASTTDAS